MSISRRATMVITAAITGILLTARDDEGSPWKEIYVIKLVGTKLVVESVAYGKAFACKCFEDWLGGQDGRTLFGTVVD